MNRMILKAVMITNEKRNKEGKTERFGLISLSYPK